MLRRSDKTKSFGSAGDILATVEQQDGVVRAWLGRVQPAWQRPGGGGACTDLVLLAVGALALLRPTSSHARPRPYCGALLSVVLVGRVFVCCVCLTSHRRVQC